MSIAELKYRGLPSAGLGFSWGNNFAELAEELLPDRPLATIDRAEELPRLEQGESWTSDTSWTRVVRISD